MTWCEECVRTVITPGGNGYILPLRRGRAVRAAGWGLAAFGALITAFMVFWMSSPIGDVFRTTSPMRWFMLAFGLTGLIGLIPGLGMLILGVGLVLGRSRCEVEVSAGRLLLSERVGPFAWRFKRRTGDVRHLVLQAGPAIAGSACDQAAPSSSDGAFGCIVAGGAGRNRLLIGLGYPLAVLKPLAERLAADLNTTTVLSHAQGDPVTVVDADQAREAELARLLEHPPKTDIVLKTLPDGVALSVPAAGLWRGSKGLFLFAILWNGFITVFVSVLLAGWVRNRGGGGPPAALGLFMIPFLAVGVAVLLIAVNMGRCHVLLAVTGGALTVRQIGPFKTRESHLPLTDIADIRVGPSGMSVNNRPVLELQIHPHEGKKVGLLSQRSEDELRWLAAVLQKAVRGA